jgi:hypothetical protein
LAAVMVPEMVPDCGRVCVPAGPGFEAVPQSQMTMLPMTLV